MSKYGEDVTVALTGISMSTEVGSVSPNIAVSLTGQQITIEQGLISAQSLITIIKNSDFPSAKQIIILKIIDELANGGIIEIKEFFSRAYDILKDEPEITNFISEIIKILHIQF